MKILFDQGVPAPLRHSLSGHSVSTAYDMSWATLSNGQLLKEANGQFDVLITTDQGLQFQQNLAGLRLAIIILPTTDWSIIRRHVQAIATAVASASPGNVVVLSLR